MFKLLQGLTAIAILTSASASNIDFKRPVSTAPVKNSVIKGLALNSENQAIPTFHKIHNFPSPISSLFKSSQGIIYVAVNGSLYYSTDGNTFNLITSIYSNININTIFEATNGTIYVTTAQDGVFYSKNGIMFNRITSIPNNYNVNGIFESQQNNIIYAETTNHGLYYTTDGINFNHIASIPNFDPSPIFEAKNGTIYVGEFNNGLFASSNGKDFSRVSSIPSTANIKFIFQAKNGDIYVGLDDVLFLSSNGKDFKALSSLPQQLGIEQILQAKNGNIYIGTVVNGVYYSTDGITFHHAAGDLGNAYVWTIKQLQNGVIYVGTVDNGLFASADGITFNAVKYLKFADEKQIYRILQTPNGQIYFIGVNNHYFTQSYSNLYTSADGNNFKLVEGIPSDFYIGNILVDQNTLYVGTGNLLFKSD